jgi:nitroimidazol reductase NimA-like FMN-containing flavoprotein (pyridoxamine 5'-phosphate oxidase superfamily)
LTPTERTTLHRRPTRGSYAVATVHAILDEALICHVGFAVEGQPYVLPTTHARVGDQLYIHGAVGGRFLKSVKGGIPVCVTVTLIDALVLARSAFHHSMNYRSVVVLGTATEVTDPVHKRRAFDALIEHVVRGRSAQIRGANEQELRATSVLAVPIVEASAKIRTGQPIDDEADYAVHCWAGLVPVSLRAEAAIADPKLAAGIALPPEVAEYKRV